jgi:hypothetical protein
VAGKTGDKVRPNPNHKANVRQAVSSLTQDPIMADIFRDTAATTLQEQARASGPQSQPGLPGNDHPGLPVEEIFEEGAAKWAQLAFAAPISKRP